MSATLTWMLLADGPSDRALVEVATWALRRLRPRAEIAQPAFRARAGRDLGVAISEMIQLHRPDVLLVHRDAERQSLASRRSEIPTAGGRIVRVVPVRMTEAWLLFDEAAIRRASGNPHGREPLGLPPLARLERVADPKRALRDALLAASGLDTQRRRRRFERDEAAFVQRTAACIDDFAPLRRLPAFVAFEEDLCAAVESWEATVGTA